MKYELVQSSKNDVNKIKEYNKKTIYQYANDLSEEEINEINDYVNKTIPIELANYQNIIIDDKMIGCLLVTNYEDGKEIAELYLEEEYRSKGIGTKIINNIIKENNILYLWVYKKNKKAISLYKRLGFIIIDETTSRYHMKYKGPSWKGASMLTW